jgi:hypothetical protein
MKLKAIPTCLAVVILSAALLWTGCSNESSTLSEAPGELNLTTEFGGYDASDEAPSFGDVEIASLMSEDEPVDDPIFTAGEVDSLEGLADSEVYTLAIRWGMLEFDSTVTTETDWSGGLELAHGFLHLNRLLRFERGQDHIVRPRPNRQTIEWVSKTTVSFDGILVTIIVPPVPEGEDWSDNSLTFRTGPYTREFPIGELAELDEIADVDNLGNQVAFNSRNIDLEPCGGGHLDGRWLLNPSGKNGHFYGRWMTEDGELGGHLRGHFGARPQGEKVLFGKYVDVNGQFRGLLRGVWGFGTDDEASGWFNGIWAGRDGRPVGKLGGNWSSNPPADGEIVDDDPPGNWNGNGNGNNPRTDDVFGNDKWTRGYFSGRWVKLCPGTDADNLGDE